MAETIGLVGVGLVGGALARNLLAGGWRVLGYDIDAARMRHLESLGGEAAPDLAEVARRCGRVLLSLMDSDVVERVVEGPGGLLAADGRMTVLVDTSTGEPDRSAALADRLGRAGVAFLDATLSGSSRQVADREAVFMIGGEPQVFESCRDLFAALARRFFHLGPAGSGCRAKLATNLVLGLNRLALAEGLVFAGELGLDPRGFLELLRETPAYSRAVDVKGEKMLREDFTPQSKVRQHEKDLRIILELAGRSGQELPLARLHRELLEAAAAAGDGDLDTSAVIRQIRRLRRGPGRP